jgi:hypothetical protein
LYCVVALRFTCPLSSKHTFCLCPWRADFIAAWTAKTQERVLTVKIVAGYGGSTQPKWWCLGCCVNKKMVEAKMRPSGFGGPLLASQISRADRSLPNGAEVIRRPFQRQLHVKPHSEYHPDLIDSSVRSSPSIPFWSSVSSLFIHHYHPSLLTFLCSQSKPNTIVPQITRPEKVSISRD